MKIVELYRYGECGWEFCIMGKKWYRTDEYGEGLWRWCWNGSAYDIEVDGTMSKYYDYKQIRGVLDFWLPENRNSAYKKIRHCFSKKIEDIQRDIYLGLY